MTRNYRVIITLLCLWVTQTTNMYGKFKLLGCSVTYRDFKQMYLRFSIFPQSLNSRPNHYKVRHKHKELQLNEKPEVNGEFYCFL